MFNKHYRSIGLLLIILLLGGFLRLYRISDYMAFLGDEGRDALIVKHLIIDGRLTLLGPITSVGLMHLGPVYYYFMAPFLLLSGLDPVGPAIMVAIFSLATILLIWIYCREFFTEKAGIVAGLLYACSPLVIKYSHSSWNPNILPFWALLIIYSLTKVLVQKNYRWLVVTGAAIGIAIQLHYVALVFFPVVFCALAVYRFRVPIKQVLLGVGGVVLTYSPFIIFELRHQFINTLTVIQFITRSGDQKSFTLMTFFNKFWDLSVRLFWRLIVVENAEISILLMFGVFSVIILFFRSLRKTDPQKSTLTVLAVWYLAGIGILSLYTGNIYDYYLMFAFPLPFILCGVVFTKLSQQKAGLFFSLTVLTILLYVQLRVTPIASPPNRLVMQTKAIANFILDKTQKQPYNFALIAAGNSDHAYRYFLDISGMAPTIIENEMVDPARQTVTGQLFVVCEETICQPLGHPLWEIAGFGRAEVTNEWDVGLFKVFKLVPYKSK